MLNCWKTPPKVKMFNFKATNLSACVSSANLKSRSSDLLTWQCKILTIWTHSKSIEKCSTRGRGLGGLWGQAIYLLQAFPGRLIHSNFLVMLKVLTIKPSSSSPPQIVTAYACLRVWSLSNRMLWAGTRSERPLTGQYCLQWQRFYKVKCRISSDHPIDSTKEFLEMNKQP